MPEKPAGWDERLDGTQVGAILADAGVEPAAPGDGTLFGESVLVLHQWPGSPADGLRYSILGTTGTVLARCARTLTEQPDPAHASFGELVDNANTDRLTLSDPTGAPLAQLTHKKVWKSRITLTDPSGQEIGLLKQENVLGKVRLGLTAGGRRVGRIVSDNTQLLGFTISDEAKNPIGRITKLGRYAEPGLLGRREVLGCYVLQLRIRPAQPLHALAVAAPLAIDLAFSMVQAGQRSLARA
ncbi:MAG TPA: hypothetical protein VF053_12640 [Streptosporangiales bacterium]